MSFVALYLITDPTFGADLGDEKFRVFQDRYSLVPSGRDKGKITGLQNRAFRYGI